MTLSICIVSVMGVDRVKDLLVHADSEALLAPGIVHDKFTGSLNTIIRDMYKEVANEINDIFMETSE